MMDFDSIYKQKIHDPKDLVEKCRSMIGTPWVHRGRSREFGLDCGGMIILALCELGYNPPDMTVYGREPARDGLTTYLKKAIGEPVKDGTIKPGDVVTIKFRHLPHHVAVVGNYIVKDGELSLIHSYGDVGFVVEHILDQTWKDQIVDVFRFEVENEKSGS